MPEIGFAFGLSAISGFVDTAGFIQLAGGFTAHITGNFVLVGAALSGDGGQGIVERLALVPIFIAAVVRASWLGRAAIRHRRSAVSTLLYAEAGALALYVALGFGFRHALRANASGAPLMLTAGAAVVAMGLQNALMREGLKTLLPTTVMTGNLTQFSLDLAALAFPEGDTALRARRHRHAVVLTGFLIGATAGAWAALDQSFLIRAIPMFAVLWLARRSAGLVAA
jgi:uncharacterized membrane protein YoaK (UPF0700 family)